MITLEGGVLGCGHFAACTERADWPRSQMAYLAGAYRDGLFEKQGDKEPSQGRDDEIAGKNQQKQRSPSQFAQVRRLWGAFGPGSIQFGPSSIQFAMLSMGNAPT
jgi:hypothetical protein